MEKKLDIGREIVVMQRHPLDMIIFFITGRCNSKCRHCFYWRNLGPEHYGLELGEIEQLTQSMPHFRTLLLSGGEPSLRDDLPQVIGLFLRNNQIVSVGVPTNGLLSERIAAFAESVSSLDDRLLVTFSVSIDGFAETHDAIRGVPGSYERAMKTLELLREVAADHDNYRTHVNTVISAGNYTQVEAFARHIQSTQWVDGHFFELVRGEPPETALKTLPADALAALYRQLLVIQEHYLTRESLRRRGKFWGTLRRVLDIGNLVNRYRHQLTAYSRNRRWDFPCMAGQSIGVIDYNGGLRACELRERSVSLVDYGLDFNAAWNSDAIREEAKAASTHSCDCTHTCFIGASMRQNFVARFLGAPWWFLRYRLGLLW